MHDQHQDQASNRTARLAGILYICMAPFAGFSLYITFSQFVNGDAAATADSIAQAGNSYTFGVVAWLISQTVFIFLAHTLYRLLRNVSPTSAQLMAALAFIGIAVSFSNEIFQLAILRLVGGGDYLSAFNAEQIDALVVLAFHLHNHGIQIAHIFWGLWLFPLAFLIWKSNFIPSVFAVLLAIAGLGYFVDFGFNLFAMDSGVAVTTFTFVGEVAFPIWLIVKGAGKRTTKTQSTIQS